MSIMREIKFRAWDSSNKRMIAHEYLEVCVKNLNKVGRLYTNHLHYMQFTGLKDKNGKEIYEGDVIKVNEHNGFIRDIRSDIGFYDLWDETNIIEIIGNIHENPELMPKDKKLVKK